MKYVYNTKCNRHFQRVKSVSLHFWQWFLGRFQVLSRAFWGLLGLCMVLVLKSINTMLALTLSTLCPAFGQQTWTLCYWVEVVVSKAYGKYLWAMSTVFSVPVVYTCTLPCNHAFSVPSSKAYLYLVAIKFATCRNVSYMPSCCLWQLRQPLILLGTQM